jgi:hypothetical protein
MVKETSESTTLSMREHEVEVLRERVKELERTVSYLRDRLPADEKDCISVRVAASCIQPRVV